MKNAASYSMNTSPKRRRPRSRGGRGCVPIARAIAATLAVISGCAGFVYGMVKGEVQLALLGAAFALTALYLLFGKDPPQMIR